MLIGIARLYSRMLLALEPVLRRLRLLDLWKIAIYLTRRKGLAFTKSVYGPSLQTDWADYQFYLCTTGRSGFKLYDILRTKRAEPFVFVDVGANMGLYSLLADKNEQCLKVYAIEPNPVILRRLDNNAKYNGANKIDLFNVGVGKANGNKKFYFKDWHSGLGNFLNKGYHCIDVVIRDSSLFDSFADQNPQTSFFLKIDVEGFETEILRQLIKSRLRQVVDEVFIEVSPMWISKEDIAFIFESMTAIGLKEIWRSSGKDQYDVYFRRPKEYKKVELERARLGSWDEISEGMPRYSICVCNYNMADTLERAMVSVVEQLDERFEVLVIDDGSSDNSVAVLEMLAQRYFIFRFIALQRDSKRQLGETRNISIRAARGEYVLLHIDADDVWQPYFQDIMLLFHKVEAAIGKDFLLVGPQIGIGKRNFLLTLGPYENVYRCEDRNLMFRLAERKRIFFMDYRVFRSRLRRPKAKQCVKTVKDVWSHTLYDMRVEGPKKRYIVDALVGPFWRDQFSLKLAILRALIVLPSYIISRFKAPIPNTMSWDAFMKYRQENRGTFSELVERYGQDGGISFLTEKAQEIFSYDVKQPGFKVDDHE